MSVNMSKKAQIMDTVIADLVKRPFPRSCLPPLQGESKCKVFVMVISSTLHMNEN